MMIPWSIAAMEIMRSNCNTRQHNDHPYGNGMARTFCITITSLPIITEHHSLTRAIFLGDISS